MKFHNDKIANNFSFYEILTLNTTNSSVISAMQKLRLRCLEPGLYAKHLKNWLKQFSSKQIFLVDGDLLKRKPHLVMNQLQFF